MCVKVWVGRAGILFFLGFFPLTEVHSEQMKPAWQDEIEKAATDAGIPLSAISIVAKETGGESIMALNADTPRKTGSVMKLLTTYVALKEWGPSFRFHTDLMANPDPSHPGEWNVALRGGGDMGFQYTDLLSLLKAAKNQGMKYIRGPIVVDNRRFMDENAITSGIDLAPDSVSGIAPYALSVSYSALELNLPANHRGELLADPPFRVSHPKRLKNTEQQNCPDNWERGLSLFAHDSSQRHSEYLQLKGEWPSRCAEGVIRRAPLSPNEQLKWSLRLAARQLGLSHHVEVMEGEAPSYSKVSIRYFSRPLANLVVDINKYSNNMAARTLLLNLAAEGGVLPARAQDGAAVIQKWLKTHKMIFPELVIENGAGLSHTEVISANHLADLLIAASQDTLFSYFLDSFPIPGERGTLQARFLARPERLQWHLKTGRLDGVRTLAGYRVKSNGSLSYMVCMIEHENADHAIALQEAILERIALKEMDTNPLTKQ